MFTQALLHESIGTCSSVTGRCACHSMSRKTITWKRKHTVEHRLEREYAVEWHPPLTVVAAPLADQEFETTVPRLVGAKQAARSAEASVKTED